MPSCCALFVMTLMFDWKITNKWNTTKNSRAPISTVENHPSVWWFFICTWGCSCHQIIRKKPQFVLSQLVGALLSLPFQTCNETINSASFVFIKNNQAQKLFTPYTTQRCGAGESGCLVWAKGAPKKPGSRNILFSFNVLAY